MPPSIRRRKASACAECTASAVPSRESGHEMLSIDAVARRLKIARSTAYRLVLHEQRMPYIEVSDRITRVRRLDLEAFIEDNRFGREAS